MDNESYYSYLNTPGNNAIYYDVYFRERKSEIYNDTENFKKITSGAFVFVMNLETLILVCEDIKKNTNDAKFDLIVGDSENETEKAINKLRDKNYINIFKRICIFTYYVEKYKYIQINYPEVKAVYFYPSEVRDFIKEGEGKTIIFRTLILMTQKDYESKYYYICDKLKNYYGKTSNYDYESAVQKAKSYLNDLKGYELKIRNYNNKIDAYNKIFNIYKNINSNKKEIIHNYTCEYDSVYQDFNYSLLRLNKRFIDSFSWFMANLTYSLDKFDSSKGLKSDITLFKGMRLDIIELINYERFEGQTICIPSFFSTSIDKNVARKFGGRGGDIHVSVRKEEGKFSCIFTINHRYYGGKPYCYDIEDVSEYKELEKERLFLPFTLFKVKSVEIDLFNYECNIELDSLGNKFEVINH